jgi:hypothetical protein
VPNHEVNNVVIIGAPENIRRFVDEATKPYPLDKDETTEGKPERIIDFNLIVPMPEELRHTVSPHEVVATQEEADQKNAEYNAQPFSRFGRGDDDPPQLRYLTRDEIERRLREYGAVDWYGWSTENYGTKWGAYTHTHYELRFLKPYAPEGEEAEVYGRVDLRFETAWSQPTPIFEKIKERWGVEVHAVTQDEGGFPDVEFGDPLGEELMRKTVTFEFDCWHTEVEEPTLNPDSVGAGYPEEAVSE